MIETGVPCSAYPTVGVLNGTTGDVIDPDVLDKVNQKSYDEWTQVVNIGSGSQEYNYVNPINHRFAQDIEDY